MYTNKMHKDIKDVHGQEKDKKDRKIKEKKDPVTVMEHSHQQL
jgi:hypothetical protein